MENNSLKEDTIKKYSDEDITNMFIALVTIIICYKIGFIFGKSQRK